MIIFLFLYAVYAGGNFYVFLKVNHAFHLGTPAGIFLGLFLIFMTASPTLIHLYSLRGSEKLSRAYACLGYMWVALIIFFSSSGILFDLYNLSARMSWFIFQKDLSGIMMSPMSTFLIPAFISIAFTAYGYFEAKRLRVERLVVKTSKLPDGVNKLTIAQISDLHLGIIVKDKMLDKVIKELEKIKPDLIVSTGDLLDGEINHIDYLADRLKMVNARLGKFAVIGNHEYFGGIKHALKFTEDAGFTLLRYNGVTVQGLINIVGVDALALKSVKRYKDVVVESEKEILSKLPPDKFTLVLKHRSHIDKDSIGLFDLQLSGHTHSGQIFPVNLVTRHIFHYHNGYISLPKGSALYVSRGAGTSGPPVRFLVPPELTIIEVVSTKENQNANLKNLS